MNVSAEFNVDGATSDDVRCQTMTVTRTVYVISECDVGPTRLQGIVYQLDVAMESIDAQRNGLVFIYDMSDSKYSNFDYDLSQKILTLLKVSWSGAHWEQ